MQEIIICVTRRDGWSYATELGRPVREFILVTPLSPHAAHGKTASKIHVTDDMRASAPGTLSRLRKHVEPALATSRR